MAKPAKKNSNPLIWAVGCFMLNFTVNATINKYGSNWSDTIIILLWLISIIPFVIWGFLHEKMLFSRVLIRKTFKKHPVSFILVCLLFSVVIINRGYLAVYRFGHYKGPPSVVASNPSSPPAKPEQPNRSHVKPNQHKEAESNTEQPKPQLSAPTEKELAAPTVEQTNSDYDIVQCQYSGHPIGDVQSRIKEIKVEVRGKKFQTTEDRGKLFSWWWYELKPIKDANITINLFDGVFIDTNGSSLDGKTNSEGGLSTQFRDTGKQEDSPFIVLRSWPLITVTVPNYNGYIYCTSLGSMY